MKNRCLLPALFLLGFGFFPPLFPAGPVPFSLPQPVAAELNSAPFKGQEVGLLAIRTSDGAVIAAVNPDRALIPASTLKTLTGACALEKLTPAFRFKTRFLAANLPDPEGVLHGSIYLQGGGDPSLRPEDLWSLVAALAETGLRRVEGDIVLDDSLFSEPGRPPSWPEALLFPAPYDSPHGALALAYNSLEIVVSPGTEPGGTQARTGPLEGLVELKNGITTGESAPLQLTLLLAPEQPPIFLLGGGLPPGAPPFREWVHIGHPTWGLGAALQSLWAAAGLEWSGTIHRGAAPESAVVLAERSSSPLGKVLIPILKISSNFGSEMLLKTLAAADGIRPATIERGIDHVRGCLATWKAPSAAVVLVDGSGFGRENRMTCRTLVSILETARKAVWSEPFRTALPQAGKDGTLRRRLPDFRGRLAAKTGTLAGVAGLAGYMTPPGSREEIIFAILINQGPGAAPVGAHLVDRLVRAIALSLPRLVR